MDNLKDFMSELTKLSKKYKLIVTGSSYIADLNSWKSNKIVKGDVMVYDNNVGSYRLYRDLINEE